MSTCEACEKLQLLLFKRFSFAPHFLNAFRMETQMSPANNKTSEKLKSLKASCYQAPFGEKRASALKHYYAAETAHEAKNDAKMNKELAAVKRVLGEISLLA
jgi:hypothetical protein